MSDQNVEYRFRGQRPNEQVLVVAKQHPWLLMPIPVVWLMVIILLAISLRLFGASGATSLATVMLVVGALGFSLYRWFIWHNGVYIITTERVIKVGQLGLFSRSISEAEIDRLQEISTEISGLLKTTLNFGTVKIQTASSSGQINLENVPDPYDIQQVIVRTQRRRPQPDARP